MIHHPRGGSGVTNRTTQTKIIAIVAGPNTQAAYAILLGARFSPPRGATDPSKQLAATSHGTE